MWPDLVVTSSPALDQHACLVQGVEDLPLTILKLIEAVPTASGISAEEWFRYMIYGDAAIYLAVIVLEICTIVLIVRRSKNFVPFYIVTSICIVLLIPVELVWLSAISTWHEGTNFVHFLERLVSQDEIQRTILAASGTSICIAYVIRSRRVANTFVR